MKRKIAFVLAVLVMTLSFTGCEQQMPLTEILSTVQGYNEEIQAMVASQVENSLPDSFTESDLIAIDDGISCRVGFINSRSLVLGLTLNDWVASDGTKISGSIQMDIHYQDAADDASTEYISSIESTAVMNYDLTSASFSEEAFDNTPETAVFTYDHASFQCYSLLVDGKPFIASFPYSVRN